MSGIGAEGTDGAARVDAAGLPETAEASPAEAQLQRPAPPAARKPLSSGLAASMIEARLAASETPAVRLKRELFERARLIDPLTTKRIADIRRITGLADQYQTVSTNPGGALWREIRETFMDARADALDASGIPPKGSATAQVLAVLGQCANARELDAVVSGIGLVPLVSALGGHDGEVVAASVLKHVHAARARDVRPGDWEGFDRYLDEVTHTESREGNRVELLNGGSEAFPRMLEAIRGAEESINLETFEFHDDATGRELEGALVEASRRGVAVSVLIDAFGSAEIGGHAVAERLRKGGVAVVERRPSAGEAGLADVAPGRLDHRKIIVVDGRTGFTGGMNLGDSYAQRPGAEHGVWRDVHTRIEGPAVADLQAAFLQQWRSEGGRVPDGVDYFPPAGAAAPEGGAGAASRVRILPHDGGKDENIRLAYLRAIDTAERSIALESPYFADTEVVGALMRAARRGVEVRVVLPRDNDQAVLQEAARARYDQMRAAGVQVYEYRGMAHQKVMVVDGRFATVGSSNLDARSLRNNHELNMMSTDPAFAARLEAAIDADIARSTRFTKTPPIAPSPYMVNPLPGVVPPIVPTTQALARRLAGSFEDEL